ncbi:hypothetical protein [Arthrobacter sp. GMC3]|uniref:hypothetical protein n=1 Tax=Arthrobacter sp. GMC3 TaxID=2058894 RepID=UPI000CE3B893|nr:hypothetical protein [Arthrobacter sp. GMC3]
MVIATLGVLVVLVALTTGATVWLIKTRPAQEQDPDSKFWYGFAGLCIVVPTILITASASALAAASLAAVAVVTGCWANKIVSRSMASRIAAVAYSLRASEDAALTARHHQILTRWSHYELDPGAAIDFPAMSDVRVPETSALVKAAALAEQLRRDTLGEPGYQEAITLLELAFERAERAAMTSNPT